jgi:hypothetical protein
MSEVTGDDLHREFKAYLQQVLKHPLVLGQVIIDKQDMQGVLEFLKSEFALSKYDSPGHSVEDAAIALRSMNDEATGVNKNKLPEGKHMSEPKNEISAGGVSGFQLPLGVKQRKGALDRAVEEAGDITHGQVLLFLREAPLGRVAHMCELLDFFQYRPVADMVREHIVRKVIRSKIREVVRKKGGGGGFVLYAPNKGKKTESKPVGTFPTKLGAKRAELSRFPPKDPGKLSRLRKQIAKLMKDPKKRADAEKKARDIPGIDITPSRRPKKRARRPNPRPAAPAVPVKKEHFTRGDIEAALLSEVISRQVKAALTARVVLGEGLFREERAGSEWDEVIGKISDHVLKADHGYQRIQRKMQQATEASLGQAVRIIQKALGPEAKVKAAKKPGSENGKTFVPFHIQVEAALVGPIYLYVDRGLPAIEMSDEAKNSLTKVTPGAGKAIDAAIGAAQRGLEKVSGVQQATAERDAYLDKMEHSVDRMISSMTPLQISMLKMLLVKKYRSLSK